MMDEVLKRRGNRDTLCPGPGVADGAPLSTGPAPARGGRCPAGSTGGTEHLGSYISDESSHLSLEIRTCAVPSENDDVVTSPFFAGALRAA